MINYIRYDHGTKGYSFINLSDEKLMSLTDAQRADYFEQYMVWVTGEDQERLEAMFEDARESVWADMAAAEFLQKDLSDSTKKEIMDFWMESESRCKKFFEALRNYHVTEVCWLMG